MNLYIDESGNTGPLQCKDTKFTHSDQPYYTLAALMLDSNERSELESFVANLIKKHKIQASELKARKIYESKPQFYNDLVDFLTQNQFPIFIECMDKFFFIQKELVDYVFCPYFLHKKLDDKTIQMKRRLASSLSKILNAEVYCKFLNAVHEYSNQSLEIFYDFVIENLISDNPEITSLRDAAINTRNHYFFAKKIFGEEKVYKLFLPLPDENLNGRLIHMLPNYSALANLLARVERYSDGKIINIIHDEQIQFESIFQSALKQLQDNKIGTYFDQTGIEKRAKFNINVKNNLVFKDSKSDVILQVSDLIAGMVMRFWTDLQNNNSRAEKYCAIIKKIDPINNHPSLYINYVVSEEDLQKLEYRMELIR